MYQKDFSFQLIKGKIAECVFDQMFRETGTYTVIPFGYESIVPELMQYTKNENDRLSLDAIRNAPDYAVVSHDAREHGHVMLVEVKYRSTIYPDEIRSIGERMFKQWKHAYLFLATPEGFYLNKCSDLLEPDSSPTILSEEIVPSVVQEKFQKLLSTFIHPRVQSRGSEENS